ncbi:hypothetical protein T07_8209 [Trichinella nelsoni]|uniref:Uncharacterized protein n=1 Tax=Trichinella nelsoni TaxID=6336 RepID=A0A0V0S0W8_9BILA|nr:hypothetical protein T07_8209 [Trichinella nelsoni]
MASAHFSLSWYANYAQYVNYIPILSPVSEPVGLLKHTSVPERPDLLPHFEALYLLSVLSHCCFSTNLIHLVVIRQGDNFRVHCAGSNDHLNATHRKLLELQGIILEKRLSREDGLDKDYRSACCRSLTANGLRKHWHQVRRVRRGTCPITWCTCKHTKFVKVYCSPDGLLNSDAGESSFGKLRASRCCIQISLRLASRNAASSENIARELSPIWEKCKKHDSETSRNSVISENIARELLQIWEKCKKHDSESFSRVFGSFPKLQR